MSDETTQTDAPVVVDAVPSAVARWCPITGQSTPQSSNRPKCHFEAATQP